MFKLLRRVSTVCKIMWKERAGVDGLNPFGQRNRCFFNGRVVFRFFLDIRYGVHPLYSYLISSVVMGFQKSWLIYILQKNPKIHPDPYTQGSYLQKIQPDPCIPGSPPLVNSPETQLCASASQPCWHHQSLSLSPSSPSPSSSNPALFLRFITLLLTPVYFWSEIIGKNLNGLILRSKILECFIGLDDFFFGFDDGERRVETINNIGEEFQMEWNKLRFVLLKWKIVKEYRHRTFPLLA